MIAVDLLDVCRRLRGPHTGDFSARETIGFQVRETPIRFAVVRSDRSRSAIRFDGFSCPAERLQRMRERQMQLRLIRRLGQDLTIERQGLAVVAKSRAYRRMSGPVDSVVRIGFEKALHLLPTAHVFMALEPCDRVSVAGGMIIPREYQYVH